MEPTSIETSDTVDQGKLDGPEKASDEGASEPTETVSVTESNEVVPKESTESTNDEKVPEINDETMEVAETSEFASTEESQQNVNQEVPMDVDDVEITESTAEVETNKDESEKEDEEKISEIEKVVEKESDLNPQEEDTSKNEEEDISKNEEEDISKNEEQDISKNEEQDISKNEEEGISKNEEEDISKNEEESSVNEDESSKADGKSSQDVESSKEDQDISSAKEDAKKRDDNDDDVHAEDDNSTEKSDKNDEDDIQTIEDDSTENSSKDKPAKEVPECVDIDMEDEEEKASSEKSDNQIETENTEFVQITQDKEDSHLESQPEDIDPFGGDSNQSNSVEAMEVDSADKSTKSNEDKQSDDGSKEIGNEKSDETSTEKEKDLEIIEDDKDKEQEKNIDESTESTSDKPDEEKDKESADDILPGQDEELSIIPDSSKGNKASEKDKAKDDKEVEKDKEEEVEKGKEGDIEGGDKAEAEKIEKPADAKEKDTKTSSSETEKSNKDSGIKIADVTSTNDAQATADKSPGRLTITTSDVIDLEDDGKEIEEIGSKEICKQCKKEKSCTIKVKDGTKSFNVCSEACKTAFANDHNKATDIPSEGVNSKREKRCANCLLIVEAKDERNLSWETMEFCNEECLGKFQTKYGSYCRNCNGAVQPVSLGKYCVRFGYDVRQFCCSTCLEEFKKGLKVCSYCQKDISAGTEGFLAPVGDKGQFKDFCTQDCMEKYSKMNSTEPPVPEKKICGVCQEEKVMYCEVQIDRNPSVPICSDPCFAAFKFVNKVDPDQCSTCKKYFQLPTKKGFVVFYEDEAHTFCNKTCLNVFIISNRKIVPCNWCKVKKYNFDMIKKELKTGQVMMMCSLNCLTLYQVSINAVSARRINCDFCKEYSQAQYHLTMSDATIRNFCSYNCVMQFQGQFKSPITIPTSETGGPIPNTNNPVPTGIPKRAIAPNTLPRPIPTGPSADLTPVNVQIAKKNMPVISSVTSLAAIGNGQPQSTPQLTTSTSTVTGPLQPITLQGGQPHIIYKQQVITRPTSPIDICNKMTQCKPQMHTKGVSVRPIPCHQETQTDGPSNIVIPIPVPIYVPFPVHMYSMPFPVPIPIPIPVPVPIFIPTTRNSAKGIFKEIKRIQEKIPSDPFEAELLELAEIVATEKKNESDSDSNDEATPSSSREDGDVNDDEGAADAYSPEGVDGNNFGDDMLQMALKMATGELDEQAVDLETALTPNTIQTPQRPQNDENSENDAPQARAPRGRKRGMAHKPRGGGLPSKRGRRPANSGDVLNSSGSQNAQQQPTQQRFIEPAEKPDANMALKYTFGVNAWKQWVITKNAELEKQSTPQRKLKLFKTELLQLTADELNYSLCLFVKEVRKPNGAEYAPDIIYYLCLGIQQYLFENNRIDNIFTDAYYEKFTDCLNEVAKKFTSMFNDSLYVVTRVEEEHLWECKQLGAHSPHVLLNTLMYFNTKNFNLVTVEEHMQLSFSHIMKHWKRNPGTLPSNITGTKTPGSRNVLLRFYPPQSALEANSKKKKVYEQQENEDNPLRCPVKLYEFYLSKCPESVKTRNDVFYLLPERSCVPDSPVWYSTTPLAKDNLIKMLHRIKMVKEINEALISS